MTPEHLREYLHELQKSPLKWPNDYFAWEKPDKTLFILGVNSGAFYELLKYEYRKPFKSYGAVCYSIDPQRTYPMSGSAYYDPVEKLISEISEYRFLGSWRDPALLMESKDGTGHVLACARWSLAKEHILRPQNKKPLSQQISGAQRKAFQCASAPARAGEAHTR